MWEVHFRTAANQTIWKGSDAEGRRCYAVTTKRLGMDVEPSGSLVYYSFKAAKDAAKEMAREAAEIAKRN